MEESTLLNRFSFLHALSTVTRYSRDDVLVPESVLSHLGWATIFAALMAEDMQKFGPVSMKKVVLGAAFHDIEESVVADVARPTKYSSPEMAVLFKRLEANAAESIASNIQSSGAHEYWANAKDRNTVEGLVVTMADVAAVVYKIWYEVAKLGNLSFIRVAEEMKSEAFMYDREDGWMLLKPWDLEKEQYAYFDRLLSNLRYVVGQCILQHSKMTDLSTMRVKIRG